MMRGHILIHTQHVSDSGYTYETVHYTEGVIQIKKENIL
jgi:hypothetical protein